jgi:hypothetical protein
VEGPISGICERRVPFINDLEKNVVDPVALTQKTHINLNANKISKRLLKINYYLTTKENINLIKIFNLCYSD